MARPQRGSRMSKHDRGDLNLLLSERFREIITKAGYTESTRFSITDVLWLMRKAWNSGRASQGVPLEELAQTPPGVDQGSQS